jgi:hypothetical protein
MTAIWQMVLVLVPVIARGSAGRVVKMSNSVTVSGGAGPETTCGLAHGPARLTALPDLPNSPSSSAFG